MIGRVARVCACGAYGLQETCHDTSLRLERAYAPAAHTACVPRYPCGIRAAIHTPKCVELRLKSLPSVCCFKILTSIFWVSLRAGGEFVTRKPGWGEDKSVKACLGDLGRRRGG